MDWIRVRGVWGSNAKRIIVSVVLQIHKHESAVGKIQQGLFELCTNVKEVVRLALCHCILFNSKEAMWNMSLMGTATLCPAEDHTYIYLAAREHGIT